MFDLLENRQSCSARKGAARMIVRALIAVKPSHLDGVNLESIYFEAQSYVLKTMLSLGLTEITRGSSQRWYQSHTDCRLEIAWR